MRIKAGQFTTKYPNPVISVSTDGTVLCSNEEGEPLLHEWGVAEGEKLLSNNGDFVIQESEANEVANLELSEVVDVKTIQSLMDDFYKLSHVPMSLDDLKGNVLVGVGWQDICTKFHRVHPDTFKHCIESSTQLSKGIPPGEFKLFKCKNNMWDMATPIVVGGQHVGNIFSGQFFFDDEPLNYEFFRSQARKYGFNEDEYITALEKVPQMSRESVETGISYLMKLANMISQLSYSNTMLSKSLTERDALLAALQESEKRERARSDELAAVLDAVPVAVMIAHDPKAIKMTGNRLSYEWIRFPEGTNISKVAPEEKKPETHKLFKDGVEISLEDMPLRVAASVKEVHDYELDVVYPDGTKRHVLFNARPLRDEQRNPRGTVAALIDITDRKNAEQEREVEKIFLSIMNESKRTSELVHSAVNFFRERFGVEAVGVRLQHDGDYPYFETNGFPEEFVRIENSLYVRDDVGKPICDNAGNPIKECMCGNVICGSFDPSKPFFTARGSFWTNSTTELLTATTVADSQTSMCNLCNSKGYESVALIALRVNEDILGLIQLNDTRTGQFSPVTIATCERLGGYLAVALAKARAEELLLEAFENLLIQSENLEIKSEEILKVNEALSESEEKYRNIIETANEGIFLMNAELKITYANKRTAEMLGYTLEEIIDRPVMDFIFEENKPFVERRAEKRRQGINESYELNLMCKDGSPFWAYINSKSLFNKDGDFAGSLTMFTDITERRQAEKALKESETLFRTLAVNSPDIIARFDRQHRHIYVNPVGEISYDFPLYEIIGKTQIDLGRDPKKVEFWEDQLENTFLTGETGSMEYHYISPLGKKYYFDTKMVPEFDSGKINSVLAISRDITDIREAEAKLKETLDNLEDLVEERTAELEKAYNSLKENEEGLSEAQKMAHLGNWDWNLISGEMYWSNELYRIFGQTPRKFSSYNEVLSCTHPEDRAYVDIAVKRALEGDPFSIDHRLVLANGEERTVHAQGDVIYDEKNRPVRMRGTVQDVTELIKSEEKIRNLAHIVESSNDAVGTISLDGKITNWNKGAEKIYGYSQEEVLGKSVSIVAPSHLSGETKKLSERVKQGESIHQYETSRLRKDGKIINVSITLSPVFDSYGKMTDISFISRDITEKKGAEEKLRESEEKFRNIVETANEGIVKTDNESAIIYVNMKMLNMLGYTVEEVIGRTIWGFISDEYIPIIKMNLEKKKQGISESNELKLIHKDGSHLWAHMNSKPLFDNEGKYMGAVSMLTDITKRKEAEETLANFEIAREKEIHHRIKNNLQVVSSLLDFHAFKFKGRKDIKDSEVIDSFRESKNRVISMSLVHEELYKGGKLKAINFSAYVDKLANNLLSIYKLGNKDITLSKNMEKDLFFDMDTTIPLGTMINEIVSNSLKYAFRGRDKGEISIKLLREKNREHIKDITKNPKSTAFVLTVSDNGVGIPENLNIEELDSLGLQLITTLVKKLGGELELKRNNGTEFVVRFTVTQKDNWSSIL